MNDLFVSADMPETLRREAGAPSSYTQELGDIICTLISHGMSLRKIVLLDGMPAMSTILLWVVKGNRGEELYVDFANQYDAAMDRRLEYWAEETVDIADDSEGDYIYTEDGKRITNAEVVARSKLRVHARQWLLGKLKRKKYGDNQTIESDNRNTNLNIESPLTDSDYQILKRLGWKPED